MGQFGKLPKIYDEVDIRRRDNTHRADEFCVETEDGKVMGCHKEDDALHKCEFPHQKMTINFLKLSNFPSNKDLYII